MTLRLTVSVIVSLLFLFTTTQLLQAQTAPELRDAGISAYGDLDLDFAISVADSRLHTQRYQQRYLWESPLWLCSLVG